MAAAKTGIPSSKNQQHSQSSKEKSFKRKDNRVKHKRGKHKNRGGNKKHGKKKKAAAVVVVEEEEEEEEEEEDVEAEEKKVEDLKLQSEEEEDFEDKDEKSDKEEKKKKKRKKKKKGEKEKKQEMKQVQSESEEEEEETKDSKVKEEDKATESPAESDSEEEEVEATSNTTKQEEVMDTETSDSDLYANSRLPSRLIIVAGTYDGVLVGWDNHSSSQKLKMTFALPDAHQGSVRSICIAHAPTTTTTSTPSPGKLISTGYDECLRILNLQPTIPQEQGEARTPSSVGTPCCSCLAPPPSPFHHATAPTKPTLSTHVLIGVSSGKIIVYEVKHFTIVHILSGHEADTAVTTLATHPSGKMALSGGRDGTVRLWDLTKGRLAYVHRLKTSSSNGRRKPRPAQVTSVQWSPRGTMHAVAYDARLTARHVATGEILLDVDLPSRVNEFCFLGGGGGGAAEAEDDNEEEECYLACACEDGSLPVLAVGAVRDDEVAGGAAAVEKKKKDKGGTASESDSDSDSDKDSDRDSEDEEEEEEAPGVIRAVMAIEPIDTSSNTTSTGNTSEGRFKCIQAIASPPSAGAPTYAVVTANSLGVLSIMDLSGAIRMLRDGEEEEEGKDSDDNGDDHGKEIKMEDSDEEQEEPAVEILHSVRVGSGARVTNMAVWSYHPPPAPLTSEPNPPLKEEEQAIALQQETKQEEPMATLEAAPTHDDDNSKNKVDNTPKSSKKQSRKERQKQRFEERKAKYKRKDSANIPVDDAAVERARKLVKQAKKRQKKKKEARLEKEKKRQQQQQQQQQQL